MDSDRRLGRTLLLLGVLLHAAALATTWVETWIEPMTVDRYGGLELLWAVGNDRPWSFVPAVHGLSLLTLLLAWRPPKRRSLRKLALGGVMAATIAVVWSLGTAALWSGVGPSLDVNALLASDPLAPGNWWVHYGLFTWGVAQALYAAVLMLRSRAADQADLATRWAQRRAAERVAAPLAPQRLQVLPSALRPLVVEAHRVRVDLDTPVRPLEDGTRTQIVELAVRLHHLPAPDRAVLRRGGADPDRLASALVLETSASSGWLTELRVVDGTLATLIDTAMSDPGPAYR